MKSSDMKKLLLLTLICSLLGACRVAKFGIFYLSKNHQKPKFDQQIIQHNPDKVFQFKSLNSDYAQQIGQYEFQRMPLDQFLDEETRTTAFLVVRNDSILYERYFEEADQNAQLPSFSVAKSFTSALVGIALQEGYIKNVNDPVTDYIEEVRALDSRWQQLTIEHLLNMRSGIDFNEDSYVNPYSSIADLYMKKNVVKYIQKAKFKYAPGERKYYSSLDTQILGLIVQRSTGKSLAAYMEEKIWQPLGMESDARWFVDDDKYGITKAFCCLHVTARDYAKFGRLFLNNGNWEGQQIIDEDWVARSVQPDFDNNCYQYQWYSGGKGYEYEQAESGGRKARVFQDSLSATKAIENPDYQQARPSVRQKGKWVIRNCGPQFYALGIFGQEVYMNPENNMIFVRLGDRWDTPTRSIIQRIERLLEDK